MQYLQAEQPRVPETAAEAEQLRPEPAVPEPRRARRADNRTLGRVPVTVGIRHPVSKNSD